jgi:multidrug resistance efflux pump
MFSYRLNLEKQQLENDQLHRKINGINTTIKDLQSTYVESQAQLRSMEENYSKRNADLESLVQVNLEFTESSNVF